ncbi:MAG: hypothetical protein QXH91_09410 [Candidatus Bathyarchaeia archaeon]
MSRKQKNDTEIPLFPIIPNTTTIPQQPNYSVWAAIEILQFIVGVGRPVGCTEISQSLNLDLTRTNRLLKTLAAIEILQQNRRRQYLPGPGLHILTAFALRGSGLLQSAIPEIEKVIQTYHHPIALGVLWRLSVCYLYYGRENQTVYLSIAGHHLFPAWQSSIGIILSSQYSDTILQQLLENPYPFALLPEHTKQEFLQRVSEARSKQYALHPEGTSLAIALPRIPRVGLAIVGPTTWLSSHQEEALVILKNLASHILNNPMG